MHSILDAAIDMPLAGSASSRRTEWFGIVPGTANTRTVGLG